jgi:hypothetical protein
VNPPIEPDRLARFLLEAKRRTYAAGGGDSQAAVPPLLAASHQLEFREGRLLYRDIYFGEAFFGGQEVVYLGVHPIWSMCYVGGFLTEGVDPAMASQVSAFLQAALRQVPLEHPFRGPRMLEDGPCVYRNEVTGLLDRFHGTESILLHGKQVYELRYIGGSLR